MTQQQVEDEWVMEGQIDDAPPVVTHITTTDEWSQALGSETSYYCPPSLLTEGFIHCARPEHIIYIADTYHKGQEGLRVLYIDTALLESEIKMEFGANQNLGLLPHIYGPLNINSVIKTRELVAQPNGGFKEVAPSWR